MHYSYSRYLRLFVVLVQPWQVSGPVYAKDHGPGRGTVRGLFSLLTSKVVRQRYRLRHIACPDVAADAIAVNDQQASSR